MSHRHGSVIFMGKICWGIFGGKNMLGGDDPSKFFFLCELKSNKTGC